MNLLEAVQNMPRLMKDVSPYDSAFIETQLKEGQTVICGDCIGENMGLKYANIVFDGILYSFKLCDSTENETVFTLEEATLMTHDFFMIHFHYLKNRDFLLFDVDNLLGDARSYFGDFSHEKIRDYLKTPRSKPEVLFFNDFLSPFNSFKK